jgi:hypothetical protein
MDSSERARSMNALRYLIVVAVCMAASAAVHSQPIVLPSDVGVTLTADPSANLMPDQPITVTITVTNYGTVPVLNLELVSSSFVDEFYGISSAPECYVGLVVEDPINDGPPTYLFFWVVAGIPGELDLAAGETRTCHFQMALTSQAPYTTPFSFGVPDFYTDPNPSNNTGTVVLQRAPPPPPVLVPALAPAMLTLLAGLLAAIAWIARRRFSI